MLGSITGSAALSYYGSLVGHYAKRILRKPKQPPIELIDRESTNNVIACLIDSGAPFMVGRYGGNEVRACAETNAIRCGVKGGYSKRIEYRMRQQAGFFPITKDALLQFSDVMDSASKQLDLLGWWGSCLQDYYIKNCMSNAVGIQMCALASLEPYYNIVNPWSRHLEGKKVLVVHPFDKSIQKTFKNREHIWSGTSVLPQFKLITYRSVQTIAGQEDERFNTWFDALAHMEEEISKIDFDIAIVGCGAYGFPLSAFIKQLGRQAIHLGGATQILFGVMGSRWENNETVKRYQNEYWTRPTLEETPDGASAVEKSCYW